MIFTITQINDDQQWSAINDRQTIVTMANYGQSFCYYHISLNYLIINKTNNIELNNKKYCLIYN